MAISTPARRMASATAAAKAPMSERAGVPATSDRHERRKRALRQIYEHGEQGRGDDQRQAGCDPVRDRLRKDGKFEKFGGLDDHVERAVFEVGLEYPVEGYQRGEERAGPKDRRGDRCERFYVRPDGERKYQHHEREENDRVRCARRPP